MKSKRKFGLFLVLLLLLVTIPLTVWSVKNLRFETRKQASEPTPVEEKEFSEIRPLEIDKPIYKFSVSGSLTLKKENSFFRIILVDKNQKEYLVYEAYPLIVEQSHFSFTNVCEETCALEAIVPDKLRIEGLTTDFEITQTVYEDRLQNLPAQVQSLGIERSQAELKKEKENLKIQKLNEQIKAKGMSWIAGETSVSGLSYEEKKKLFSKPDGTPVDILPNLQGFEYYKGGIFEIKDENENNSPILGDTDSNLPESWDWRNVHGENWNTPVRYQDIGCVSFARIAPIETLINIYYNQHLDIDLAEGILMCNNSSIPRPLGMAWSQYPECPTTPDNVCAGAPVCIASIHGIPEQSCISNGNNITCSLNEICTDWEKRSWSGFDFHDYSPNKLENYPCNKMTKSATDDDIKRALVKNGPLQVSLNHWGHEIMLSGYNEVGSDWKIIQNCGGTGGDEICTTTQGCISRYCKDEQIGETISFCNNKFDSNLTESSTYVYRCEHIANSLVNKWVFQEKQDCGFNKVCISNQCSDKSLYSLKKGERTCSSEDISKQYLYDYVEYNPGNGSPYWIFKNSWGSDWGEGGYFRMTASLELLATLTQPLAPIIPPKDTNFWPTGFDGTIKCVDKDNDGYCNWGISENKPETCPAFCKPQKDCDDSNADLGPFDENLNCTLLNISPTPSETCPRGNFGNLDCSTDEVINNQDLDIIFDKWASEGPVPTPNPGQKSADLNNDNKVQETDLTIPLFNWSP